MNVIPAQKNVVPAYKAAMRPAHRLLVAAEVDRAELASGPLSHLVHYPAPGDPALLEDCFPLLGVALSDEGETLLSLAIAKLRRLRSVPDIAVVRLAGADAIDARLLADLLQGPLADTTGFVRSLLSELTMLRRERERLMANFRALEDAFLAHRGAPVVASFEQQPFVDAKDEDLSYLLADSGLTQLLPVSSSGVSGIGLHFPDRPRPSGILRIALECVETDVVHGVWDLASEKTHAGWTYLALSRACDSSAHSLRLRLRTLEGVAPDPSLGHPIPHRRFAIQSPEAGPNVEYRPLAFRVYSGLPNLRPSDVMAMLAVVAQDRAYRDISFHLPLNVLERVLDISIRTEPASFEIVRCLAHEGAVVCHPMISGVSLACLPEALPAGAISVVARAWVDHPDGAPARVAIVARAPGQSLEAMALAIAEGPDAAVDSLPGSGWRVVTNAAPVSISLQLPEGLPEAHDLVIAAVPAGPTVDFCWLKLSEIRVTRRLPEIRP